MKYLKEVLSLPIVAPETGACDLAQLDRVLCAENEKCAEAVAQLNDGPIAICLSGGVDSSLSLAMIRRKFPTHRILAYTMGTDEQCPDIVHAAEVAERFQVMVHRVLMPTHEDSVNALKAIRPLFERKGIAQVSDGSIASYLLFQQLKKDGVKSVIHHRGADELFGGSWSHRDSLSRGTSPAFSVFEYFWSGLERNHLRPAHLLSTEADIRVVYPYLRRSVVETVTRIKLESRTSLVQGKIPLRDLACRYRVPESVIGRPKRRLRDSIPPTATPTT